MNSIDGPFFKGSTLTYRTLRQSRKRLSFFIILCYISDIDVFYK